MQPRRALLTPDEATFECLTALRRPDIASFRQLLVPEAREEQPSTSGRGGIAVGGDRVTERGPLAGYAHVLDAAARRTLPGHLLRRCRILSSVQLGGTALQRVAVTACSGEESVFEWRLLHGDDQLLEDDRPGSLPDAATSQGSGGSNVGQESRSSSSQSSGGGGGSHGGGNESEHGPLTSRWLVTGVNRDASADGDEPMSSRPRPRAPPEAIIAAQLAALRRGDVVGAAAFNMEGRNLNGPWEQQLSGFRALLRQPAYHVVLTHDSHRLGAAALPSQRTFVTEVVLRGTPTALEAAARAAAATARKQCVSEPRAVASTASSHSQRAASSYGTTGATGEARAGG
ncbi:hypothetical protein FOA52_014425 [Chlamydomonas sp. UWO 241]|nr:hypothetical protein FOA52_014425 [Chlamydomonas sp. UWO 241]